MDTTFFALQYSGCVLHVLSHVMSCKKIHGHADNGRAIPSYGILTTASVHVKDSVYLSKLNLMQGIVFALLNVERCYREEKILVAASSYVYHFSVLS
ncbi:hypothetical protein EVAR_99036_1 [Eumeta japonica]|uniref:Uncharacterized protein n=1 Tax=Eumeta variegata TaxID=151549 RepID=A0A4C1XYR0_EUMVA|nr:hypothetical protein EVAR_99036_1 [Eumeta japonica]